MKPTLTFSGSVLALLLFPACGGSDAAQSTSTAAAAVATASTDPSAMFGAQDPAKRVPPVRLDMDMVKRLFGNQPKSAPSDNTVTEDKVALGRALYHEKHLSKNGNLSCASCHDLDNWGQDGKRVSPGSDGKDGDRNTPTVLNAFRQFAQFWDGRAATVEEQAIMPVLNPVEHGIADEAQLVAKIKEKPELVEGFKKAFPGEEDPVTPANFGKAIGAFERTLVTRSRFDDFLDGDQKALSNEEKLGLKYFIEVGCITCHMSRLLGGEQYQKVGLIKPYPTEDIGRAKVTGNEAEKFFFKVPSLLNVEKTAPYYHDGKVATLEEAVKNMASIQLGRELKAEEVTAMVAFLKSLTAKPVEAKK